MNAKGCGILTAFTAVMLPCMWWQGSEPACQSAVRGKVSENRHFCEQNSITLPGNRCNLYSHVVIYLPIQQECLENSQRKAYDKKKKVQG